MKTHFDDVFDRATLKSLETKLHGRDHATQLAIAEQELGSIMERVHGGSLHALRDLTCCLMRWTALYARDTHFSDLRRDPTWCNGISLMGGEERQMNVNARLFFHASRYMLNGYRTFEIDPSLAELMRHTELQGLTGADLHLPYCSMYLAVPPESGLRVWNDQTNWHRLAGVYLMIEDGHDYGKGAVPGLEGLPGRTLRALIVGEWEMKDIVPGFAMPDDALLYWSVPLVDDWPLDRCIRSHKNHARDFAGRLPATYTKMTTEWDEIFTWLVNVVMYATCGDARSELRPFDPKAEALRRRMNKAKSPKRRKTHASELAGMDQRRYTVLGRGVPSLRKASGTGTPLDKRVLVSGHWRNQAVGPRWSERRRILIEPFWRGPEDASESEAVHRLV